MAHLAVAVALLFLACVHAAPAPEPNNVTFVKDTSFGGGAAQGNSKAHGLVQSSKPTEAPEDSGNKDVALVDDVNVGVAFASRGSIATGVLKNNKFANMPTEGAGYKV